jgi:T6SS, Phospholipase effector Tle1-like, catalytic domain
MRNLIVCADGTWNTPDDKDGGLPAPTNVVKLYNALSESAPNHAGPPIEQKRYYHPGVGTDGSKLDRLLGGGMGKGLNQNIKSGYKWLAEHYRAEDRIFLFGFSRGAYTVRSLGGTIGCCGLLDLKGLDDKTLWERVDRAFDCYRDPKHVLTPLDGWQFHNAAAIAKAPESTPIYFIGVWDTVGALGVPDDLAVLDLIDDPTEYAFHNTRLSKTVTVARHALAMDEMRKSFTPTLWTDYSDTQDVKQIWFPGVHGDVGGGYLQKGLSDGALAWMMKEATDAGLGFRDDIEGQIVPNPHDALHDSDTGIFSKLKTEPRQVPRLSDGASEFHSSSLERHKSPPLFEASFWPTKVLAGDAQSATIRIYASQRWNGTGLFLEAGTTYRFAAEGEWLDGTIPTKPSGSSDGKFHVGEIGQALASGWGILETFYRNIRGNQNADFWYTKRIETENWFALIGVVANAANQEDKQKLPESEVFLIGNGADFKPKKGGYLYCFANDAWHAYHNNKGSVTLTVTRL